MRFMMLALPRGYQSAAPRAVPAGEHVESMMRYNEELQRSGVLLAVLGGWWMIQVKSREEAVEWARRCPALPDDVVEVRQAPEN
jgi:hypothetical protein